MYFSTYLELKTMHRKSIKELNVSLRWGSAVFCDIIFVRACGECHLEVISNWRYREKPDFTQQFNGLSNTAAITDCISKKLK